MHLREARAKSGLTQKDLAQVSSQDHYSGMARGREPMKSVSCQHSKLLAPTQRVSGGLSSSRIPVYRDDREKEFCPISGDF